MNGPVNLFWSESSHYFGANSPVRIFERNVPEESSREELVLERTVPEPSRENLSAGFSTRSDINQHVKQTLEISDLESREILINKKRLV